MLMSQYGLLGLLGLASSLAQGVGAVPAASNHQATAKTASTPTTVAPPVFHKDQTCVSDAVLDTCNHTKSYLPLTNCPLDAEELEAQGKRLNELMWAGIENAEAQYQHRYGHTGLEQSVS